MKTAYGFRIDEIAKYEVSRICSDKKFGEILKIETEKEIVEIKITPSGLIRIDRHQTKKQKMTKEQKTESQINYEHEKNLIKFD